jgi:hypothetical protein
MRSHYALAHRLCFCAERLWNLDGTSNGTHVIQLGIPKGTEMFLIVARKMPHDAGGKDPDSSELRKLLN